jgi:tRNA pseudouridine55 synthase
MSSARAVAAVKKILKAKKVGHAGTLDPFATGVLVCCINQATKLARFFLGGSKKYQAVLHLGSETDTQDATGTTIAACPDITVSAQQVHTVCKLFEGEYWQAPPVFSALKHHGIPLYKFARSGNPIQKPPRRVEIQYIKIQAIDLPFIQFEVSCSAGTYIRTLCSDIGKKLGCGGHLKQLTRLGSSGFSLAEAISLSDLKHMADTGKIADGIIPMAQALRDIPAVVADKALTENIKHGRVVYTKSVWPPSNNNPKGLIKILDTHLNLIAILGHQRESDRMKYLCVFKN